MLSRRQFQKNFRLTAAIMNMIFICRYIQIEFFLAILAFADRRAIDENVVMACIAFFHSGRSDAHAGEAENNFHRARNRVPILQIHKILFSTRCRWQFARQGSAG